MGDIHNTANFSRDNAGYQVGQVTGNIETTINNYYSKGQPLSSDASSFVQSFSSNYRHQKDLNPRRFAATCEWFLNDARFRDWRDARDARLLHVYAGPGCGKSVLSRSLIDEQLIKTEHTPTVLYFFFKHAQGDQDRATSAIAAVLHQIYCQHQDNDLKVPALAQFELHGSNLRKLFNELWDVFLATIERISGGVACVFDALDECKENDRKQLIEFISRYYEDSESNYSRKNLKFLITSRPYLDVRFELDANNSRTTFIPFDGDNKSHIVAEEINGVIERKIMRKFSSLLGSNVRSAIIEHLQSMPNRTYLWLELIIGHIEQNLAGHGTEKKMRKLIQELPGSIDKIYDDMLCRSPEPETTKRILSIVIAATRPLTTHELSVALELTTDKHEWFQDIDSESEQLFRENSLKLWCGLLLSVHNFNVYFLHDTAREFLIRTQAHKQDLQRQWKHSIYVEDAESVLATACITLLDLKDLKEHQPTLGSLLILDRFGNVNRYGIARDAPFLLYAAANWIVHYRKSHEKLDDDLAESLLSILVEISKPSCISKLIESESSSLKDLQYTPGATISVRHAGKDSYPSPLIFASGEGCPVLVQQLLRQGVNVHENDESLFGTALHAAVRGGYEQVLSVLLSHGADHFIEDSLGHNALYLAAVFGRNSMIRLLLEEGHSSAGHFFSLMYESPETCENVLRAAVECSGIEAATVQMLLARHAGKTLTAYAYVSLAEQAVLSDQMDKARMLLDQRSGCCSHSLSTDIILQYAAQYNNTEHLLQVIIDHFGAALDLKKFHKPLQMAAKRSNEKLLKCLLTFSRGAVATESLSLLSALDVAVGCRYHRNVQLLLEDPRLQVSDSSLGQLLSKAVHLESEEILWQLLGYGSSRKIAISDDLYSSLLSVAIARYNDNVLQILLTDPAVTDKLDAQTYARTLCTVLDQGRRQRVKIVLNRIPAGVTIADPSGEFDAALASGVYANASAYIARSFDLPSFKLPGVRAGPTSGSASPRQDHDDVTAFLRERLASLPSVSLEPSDDDDDDDIASFLLLLDSEQSRQIADSDAICTRGSQEAIGTSTASNPSQTYNSLRRMRERYLNEGAE